MDNKCAIDVELEKKHELERRKKTRLLQVRHQAKDFARKMRQNVLAESMYQQKRVLENKKKKLIEDQKEKLKRLEEMYHTCIENVGEGHKNALIQPNINQIRKLDAIRKASDASKRGENARKKHFEREAIYRQQREAPIIRKEKIRTRENLRSCYISSLPKPEVKREAPVRPQTIHPKPEYRTPAGSARRQSTRSCSTPESAPD